MGTRVVHVELTPSTAENPWQLYCTHTKSRLLSKGCSFVCVLSNIHHSCLMLFQPPCCRFCKRFLRKILGNCCNFNLRHLFLFLLLLFFSRCMQMVTCHLVWQCQRCLFLFFVLYCLCHVLSQQEVACPHVTSGIRVKEVGIRV